MGLLRKLTEHHPASLSPLAGDTRFDGRLLDLPLFDVGGEILNRTGRASLPFAGSSGYGLLHALADSNTNFYRKLQSDPEVRRAWFESETDPTPLPGVRTRDGHYYRFDDYGDAGSVFGWDVDHIIPQADGGCDEAWNLRPLNSSANRGHRGR